MADDLTQNFLRGLPERPTVRRVFRLGDVVRIRSGPFASFPGRVEGINQAKSLLKVRVEVLGRERSLKFGFREVEKVSEA